MTREMEAQMLCDVARHEAEPTERERLLLVGRPHRSLDEDLETFGAYLTGAGDMLRGFPLDRLLELRGQPGVCAVWLGYGAAVVVREGPPHTPRVPRKRKD